MPWPLDYLQQRRLRHLSWQPVPLLSHPHSAVFLCSDGTYTQHLRQCPDGTSQVCFGVCMDESRQRNCLVMTVVNEENVTAHNFRAYSSSFNNEETTRLLQKNLRLFQNNSAGEFSSSVVKCVCS